MNKKDRTVNYKVNESERSVFKGITMQFRCNNCTLAELKAAFNRYNNVDFGGYFKVVSYS